jgi:hypothetical protein
MCDRGVYSQTGVESAAQKREWLIVSRFSISRAVFSEVTTAREAVERRDPRSAESAHCQWRIPILFLS